MFLFQVLFHYCFIRLLKHFAVFLGHNEVYSLEFTTTSVPCELRISFWQDKMLMTMSIAHCGRDAPSLKSRVLLCSLVLNIVSLEPTNICCVGERADFIKTLDKAPSQKAGIECPFTFLPLQIVKLCTIRALVYWAKETCF